MNRSRGNLQGVLEIAGSNSELLFHTASWVADDDGPSAAYSIFRGDIVGQHHGRRTLNEYLGGGRQFEVQTVSGKSDTVAGREEK